MGAWPVGTHRSEPVDDHVVKREPRKGLIEVLEEHATDHVHLVELELHDVYRLRPNRARCSPNDGQLVSLRIHLEQVHSLDLFRLHELIDRGHFHVDRAGLGVMDGIENVRVQARVRRSGHPIGVVVQFEAARPLTQAEVYGFETSGGGGLLQSVERSRVGFESPDERLRAFRAERSREFAEVGADVEYVDGAKRCERFEEPPLAGPNQVLCGNADAHSASRQVQQPAVPAVEGLAAEEPHIEVRGHSHRERRAGVADRHSRAAHRLNIS